MTKVVKIESQVSIGEFIFNSNLTLIFVRSLVVRRFHREFKLHLRFLIVNRKKVSGLRLESMSKI